MPQKDSILTVPRVYDFLEPAIDPNSARTIHAKLTAAATDTTVSYPAGQIIVQKNDFTNEWAKIGTAGFGGAGTARPRVMKYPVVVNDDGFHQKGTTWITDGEVFEGTVAPYYEGKFKTTDLVGLDDGTNQVRTETVTATGGTRTLSITNPITGEQQTTAALAFDALAATIQAALVALSNVAVGDVVVTGLGPFVYTFGGSYANKPVALAVNTGSLTGGSSSIADTTPGVAENISSIGSMFQGSVANGIIHLGH
jgi:hypothetical protein